MLTYAFFGVRYVPVANMLRHSAKHSMGAMLLLQRGRGWVDQDVRITPIAAAPPSQGTVLPYCEKFETHRR
jgi:hypothetical protein